MFPLPSAQIQRTGYRESIAGDPGRCPLLAEIGVTCHSMEKGAHMPLKEQIASDLKDAMKAGEAIRRDTLRSLLTAINNAEIAGVDISDESASRQGLSEESALAVVQRQAKQRRESIEEFRKANRTDLADKEAAELVVLEAYLPQQLGRDEIAAEVRAVIADTGATGPADKAKVMPAAIARLKGRADGRLINEVVTELLTSA